jgi:SAM-dependent methyltransferase
LLPVLFAVTLFVGAALLFLVQPLVGKLLLPLVGGSPGVWNTCMVFFQAVLLGGYLYAHRSTGHLGVRRQAVVHLLLLAAVLVAFKAALAATGSPVPVFASLLPDDQDYPVLGLVALLAVAVGIPFFVLSTTSPLLQRWFAATRCPSARDPYFLYAASNAGSLLGLLCYPFLIEPELTLAHQQWVFAGGVVVYVVLVLLCALTVIRGADRGAGNAEQKTEDPAGPELRAPSSALRAPRIARWVFLSALPSSLLLGVTTHVSTDLAPVPLLWVVPLALYLLSFILVFARWPDPLHRAVGRLTPLLILFVVLSLLLGEAEPFGLVAALHLGAFFGVCLVCHGELAKDRPPPEHLTAFYFWLSLGGVLGGFFNALVAPVVFHKLGMVEYPLALILAAAVRPRTEEPPDGPPLRAADVVVVLVLLALSVGLVLLVPRFVSVPVEPDDPDAVPARLLRGGLMFGLPAAAAFALFRRPARYALSLAALFAAGAFGPGQLGDTLHMERNFFGVVRVTKSPDGKFVRLIHGTTLHGQQRADADVRPEPMTYYHKTGPVGTVFEALPAERLKRVGVVGLGTGAVAYYAKPGQDWTFFEIDPAVARVARDYFRFLPTCRADACDVVLGDARRQLARLPDSHFDLIILDGFCSDAIPVHLLTREAVRLYFQKLTPGGVLAVHISNSHLDLPPLVARLAADHDPPLCVRYCRDAATEAERADGKTDSQWMVLARGEGCLGKLAAAPEWQRVPRTDGPVWRDDFANLLRVWKKRDGG